MVGDTKVPVWRKVTNVLGFTDSPQTRARIMANSTARDLLVRAVIPTLAVVLLTAVFLLEQDPGFGWLIIADICIACVAAAAWARWVRYRHH